MGITRAADYKSSPHILLNLLKYQNYSNITQMMIELIQVVTERYVFAEDDIVYFTLKRNIRKQGEGI